MKRTLALVLALVMAIGLMAFPVSADFTDDADIKYTEAVDVMSAIGVIDGFEDGSFDPDGYLTREQAAKVVAYLMLGAEDADALTASSAPFDDVAANRWSAGYIAYCVNEGIINGRSDTTFDPTGNVTGYEFAKLMLGCLGYDGAIEKYTGATWNINVAKTALTVGLFSGNRGANYNVPLTREEAALYAFNMIQADLVDYDNRGSEIDLGNGMTINTGASTAKAIETDNDEGTIDNDGVVQFAERYFEDLEKDAGSDDAFGRPSTEWTYDRDDVGTYSDTADITYTVGTEGRDVYDDLGDPDSDARIEYYVDGASVAIDDIYDGFDITSNNSKKIGGNGVLVEIYEMTVPENAKYDEYYRVVVINSYVGTISDWTEADEDENVEESVDIATITEPSDVNTYLTGIDTAFETTKFDDGDVDDETVVIYTAAWNSRSEEYEIKSVDVAEVVTATPSRVTDSSFVAGGETYKYNKVYDGKVDSDDVKADDDLDIYLDAYGYVVYTTASGGDNKDYALVLGIEKSNESFSRDEWIVKLLLANGEIVVADVENDDEIDAIDDAVNGANDNAVIVTYTVNRDDEYTLTMPALESRQFRSLNTSLIDINRGSARVYIDTEKTRYYANSNTVFFTSDDTFVDSKDSDFDAYVGIANVPSISERDSNTGYVVVFDGNEVVAMYVANGRTSSSVSKDLIAVAVDKDADYQYDTDLGAFYEFDVVNGDTIETLMFEEAEAEKLMNRLDSGDDMGIVMLASMSIDEDDIVTDIDFATEDTDYYAGTTTNKVDNDLVGLGGTRYSYSDDCAVYRMDDNAEWSSSSINSIRDDNTDNVTFVYDEDDEIVTAIYIQEVSGR